MKRSGLSQAVGLDLLCVVVFVAIGRRQHETGSAIAGIAKTATPFLLGLAISWLALRREWSRPTTIRTGIGIWIGTLVVGMLGRRFFFEGGTATAFVIVATLFLGATMLGWRSVVSRRAAR